MLPIIVLSMLFLGVACVTPQTTPAPAHAPEAKTEAALAPPIAPAPLPAIDFARHGLTEAGCFLLHDVATGAEQVSDRQRCAAGRRPNSTFKIVNALIGADLGLLTGPDAIMVWDAARYPKQPGWFEGWDRDQPLREAMRISAVPLFRKLASDIGAERMAAYLSKLRYGNQDMSAGIDSFWLEGNMRITPAQQLALVTGLVRDELPVSKSAQAIVREVLKKDPIHGAAHNGKTGSGWLETPDPARPNGWVGWMVGWIELPRGPVTYAMWVEAADFDTLKTKRLEVVEGVLGNVVDTWK